MTDQYPLPVEIVPAPHTAPVMAGGEETPAERTPKTGTSTFTVLAGIPWRFSGWNLCCTQYGEELWLDQHGYYFCTYTHADECEAWTYL